MQATIDETIDILTSDIRPMPVGITTIKEPKHNKRGNPFYVNKEWMIEKVSEFGAFLGDYEQRYNHELQRQGIDDYYHSNPMWPNKDGIGQGEHINLFIARHIVTGQLYLKYEPRTVRVNGVIFEAIAKVQYRYKNNLVSLNATELATLSTFKSESKFGLIAWNTVKIENISQIRFGGECYEIK